MNGDVVSGGDTSFSSTADVQCKQDYVASNKTIRCEKTGRWTNTRCNLKGGYLYTKHQVHTYDVGEGVT